MLQACGVNTPEELFSHLPDAVRLNRPLDLAPGISEYEIVDYFRARASENASSLLLIGYLIRCFEEDLELRGAAQNGLLLH
jgi:glycine cleavage system pyridoxal-binding protein P